jgi:hypothetical protein
MSVLDDVLVELVNAKLSSGKLISDDVARLLGKFEEARAALTTLEREVRNACSHTSIKGKKTTQPTGGGMAQCYICCQEID